MLNKNAPIATFRDVATSAQPMSCFFDNPKINSNLNAEGAIKYVNWLISDNGKELINNFKVNNEQLFFYNYK